MHLISFNRNLLKSLPNLKQFNPTTDQQSIQPIQFWQRWQKYVFHGKLEFRQQSSVKW